MASSGRLSEVRGAGAVALKLQLRAVALAETYLAEREELGGAQLAALIRLEAPKEVVFHGFTRVLPGFYHVHLLERSRKMRGRS